jgi:hypothetical protein
MKKAFSTTLKFLKYFIYYGYVPLICFLGWRTQGLEMSMKKDFPFELMTR